MSSSRMRGRAATVAALAGSAVLLAAVPAFAHVTVQPSTAAKGSYSTVSFKVPCEEDNASTVKLEVNLPTDHPIASVSIQPVPGWTAKVTTTKLTTPLKTDDGTVTSAVTKITWTGGKIEPGQFQQFPVSLGPLPEDTGTLTFKALQTYSDGNVVRWIEIPQAGQPEPQNPAPSLQLTEADSGSGATPTATGSAASAPQSGTAAASTTAAAGDSDGTARALGIAGIVVGVIGVGFGVYGGRRRTAPAGTGGSGGSGSSAGAGDGSGDGSSPSA
ncbi:YcnI family copper-binding membrane protein [Actinacidiphila sp. bgisy144]|uniref:YcnI family copper-binding membrane protein n=1 Tax=Actinacidiphila sp. bgisy144 TaxID=3413791 RepID=UPI003EBDE4BC